jgi:hypothetical protein
MSFDQRLEGINKRNHLDKMRTNKCKDSNYGAIGVFDKQEDSVGCLK